MIMEYLEIDEAISSLKLSLDEYSDRLGEFLQDYGFYHLKLYVEKNETLSEADGLTTDLYYKHLRKRYPASQIAVQLKLMSPFAGINLDDALSENKLTQHKKFYWLASDFYKNPIFSKLSTQPPKVVGYRFGVNMDEMARATIENLKTRIAELESQATKPPTQAIQPPSINNMPASDEELPPNSKKAVAKLLYALLLEHKYTLNGAVKGATNSQLENLTKSHGVPMGRQTIANWLKAVNDIHHERTK